MKKLAGLCPRCGAPWSKKHDGEGQYPALSRRDNKTDICSECGVKEAFEDAGMAPPYGGPAYWKVTP
jgi:hypothetical protein